MYEAKTIMEGLGDVKAGRTVDGEKAICTKHGGQEKLVDNYSMYYLPDSADPFGQSRAQYTFENLCVEDKELRLKDGTKKIFFNTTAYGEAEDTDVREFLKYVNGGESDHLFVKTIKDKVEQVKSNKE